MRKKYQTRPGTLLEGSNHIRSVSLVLVASVAIEGVFQCKTGRTIYSGRLGIKPVTHDTKDIFADMLNAYSLVFDFTPFYVDHMTELFRIVAQQVLMDGERLCRSLGIDDDGHHY